MSSSSSFSPYYTMDGGVQLASSSKFRLIRSPRFVKQLSDVRAAGRQQMLQMAINGSDQGSNGSLNSRGRMMSTTQPNQSIDAPLLLLMMNNGAFPSPRSTSTTASIDNLQPNSAPLLPQPASFFPSQSKVQLQPRTLLVVPPPPPPQTAAVQQSSSTAPNISRDHLAAISCLASPPWTRSTSPASPQSNTNSFSPPPDFTFGPQAPVILPCSPPPRVPVITRPSPTRIIIGEDDSPPSSYPPARVSEPSPLLMPPIPPPLPSVTTNLPQKSKQQPETLTPFQLISTTARPAQQHPRSQSAAPFCANEGSDAEPFTLVHLPNIDPSQFPEQSWAYRNVRKLVSRLSAHVKARRRALSASHSPVDFGQLRNAVSSDALSSSRGKGEGFAYQENDMGSTESLNEKCHEDPRLKIREELYCISQNVKEQFGGSLATLLRSTPAPRGRTVSLPPSTRLGPIATSGNKTTLQSRPVNEPPSLKLTSGRSVPVIQTVPRYPPRGIIVSCRNSGKSLPQAQPQRSKPVNIAQQQQQQRQPLTSCQNLPTRCMKCAYCRVYLLSNDTSQQNTPLMRYGLTGRHIHLPPEELDLNARNDNYDDFDETDVPRSAVSPQCGFARPMADDMFQRSIHAVRF